MKSSWNRLPRCPPSHNTPSTPLIVFFDFLRLFEWFVEYIGSNDDARTTLPPNVTTPHAWCEQCLPGQRKPYALVLRPDIAGILGSMVIRLRPCMT